MTTRQITTQFVVGSLRAYRLWEYLDLLGYGPGRQLCALIWRRPLPPGVQRAECRFGLNSLRHNRNGGTPPPVPSEDCTCGFYGVAQGDLLGTYRVSNRYPEYLEHDPLLFAGSVQLSGRIIVGDTGVVRAELMELESLFSLGASYNRLTRSLLVEAGEKYQVPVHWDPVEFEERYPLTAINGLFPPRPVTVDPVKWRTPEDFLMSMGRPGSALLREFQEKAHKRNWDTAICDCPACREHNSQAADMEKAMIDAHAVNDAIDLIRSFPPKAE